jgi:SAM-dependent methyltransferase
MIGSSVISRSQLGRRQRTFAVFDTPAEPYSFFSQVYDFLIGDSAFPYLQQAFWHSVKTFAPDFRSLADVGCGTGRFLLQVSRLPIELIGIDRSESILTVAGRRVAHRPVLLLRQDMRHLRLPRPVDLITCRNQTINYLLSANDLRRAFRAVAGNLRRGGTFLFDFIARLAVRFAASRIRETIRLPDHTLEFDGTINPARNLSTIRIRLIPRDNAGSPILEVHRQRWFRPAAIARLLGRAGFRLLEMRPIPGAMDNAWLHVVARRV